MYTYKKPHKIRILYGLDEVKDGLNPIDYMRKWLYKNLFSYTTIYYGYDKDKNYVAIEIILYHQKDYMTFKLMFPEYC